MLAETEDVDSGLIRDPDLFEKIPEPASGIDHRRILAGGVEVTEAGESEFHDHIDLSCVLATHRLPSGTWYGPEVDNLQGAYPVR